MLIDNGDPRVRKGAEVLDEAVEPRKVERSARHAGDRAASVDQRHGNRHDRHVRQPPEDDVRDRHRLRAERLDEILAVADRR